MDDERRGAVVQHGHGARRALAPQQVDVADERRHERRPRADGADELDEEDELAEVPVRVVVALVAAGAEVERAVEHAHERELRELDAELVPPPQRRQRVARDDGGEAPPVARRGRAPLARWRPPRGAALRGDGRGDGLRLRRRAECRDGAAGDGVVAQAREPGVRAVGRVARAPAVAGLAADGAERARRRALVGDLAAAQEEHVGEEAAPGQGLEGAVGRLVQREGDGHVARGRQAREDPERGQRRRAVEARRRLVAEEDGGRADELLADGHAPELAAREHGAARRRAPRQLERVEHAVDLGRARGGARAEHAERGGEVERLARREPAVEQVRAVLRRERDRAPPVRGQRPAAEEGLAARETAAPPAGEHLEQRRLAAARRAHDGQHAPPGHDERDVAQEQRAGPPARRRRRVAEV